MSERDAMRIANALEIIASLLEQILDNGIGIQPRCVHGNVATKCNECHTQDVFIRGEIRR